MGWPTKGKQCLAPQIAGEPPDHPARPAIQRVGCAIMKLGLGRDMGPKSRLPRAKHEKRLAALGRAIFGARMEPAKD